MAPPAESGDPGRQTVAEYQIAELLESYGKRVFNLAYRLTGNQVEDSLAVALE